MTHTILLLQQYKDKKSRTFSDHENVFDALEFFVKSYEKRLKELNPHMRHLDYEVKDLLLYIDDLPDIGILTFDERISAYVPHDRHWIQQKTIAHLKKSMQ